ncbi:MAG: hypothetical protein N3A01_07760 [Bacteroidales bacterium]|nr:hypothetical protein [Bacteroidales bacterium]
MKNFKTILIYLIAFTICFSVLLFQRKTGPTYPYPVTLNIDDSVYSFKLPRSANNDKDLELVIPKIKNFSAYVSYRKYRYDKKFETKFFVEKNNKLVVTVPSLPSAGKYEYNVFYYDKNNQKIIKVNKDPVIIRFKNKVPDVIVVLHIIFIFLGFLSSNISGLLAVFNTNKINLIKKFSLITLLLFLIGGFIMGPIMQKLAFGVWWSGFPFGIDLTDNKMLFSFITWVICFIRFVKTKNNKYIIAAALLTIVIFLIPHSLLGSEYDFKSSKVVNR